MRSPWCSTRCSEAATRKPAVVPPGGGDLAEHVLVEVALGVTVGHVDVVELVDDVGQHASRGHHEERVLHVMGVCRSLVRVACLPDRLDEREHPIPHGLEHLLRRKLLETRPAQSVLVGGEHRLLDGVAGAGGLALLARVQLVQTLDEQQVGELLDDRERVRDAAGRHGLPDAVDLGLQLTGDHDSVPRVCIESTNRRDLREAPRADVPLAGGPKERMLLGGGFYQATIGSCFDGPSWRAEERRAGQRDVRNRPRSWRGGLASRQRAAGALRPDAAHSGSPARADLPGRAEGPAPPRTPRPSCPWQRGVQLTAA